MLSSGLPRDVISIDAGVGDAIVDGIRRIDNSIIVKAIHVRT